LTKRRITAVISRNKSQQKAVRFKQINFEQYVFGECFQSTVKPGSSSRNSFKIKEKINYNVIVLGPGKKKPVSWCELVQQ
jgi:hypothetical protein